MNLQETTFWVNGLFPGDMTMGRVGKFTVAHFKPLPEDEGPVEFIASTVDYGAVETGLVADDNGREVRVEIFTVANAGESISELVSGAASMLVDAQGKILPQPGELLPGLGLVANQDVSARNGLLISPFVWGSEVPRFDDPDANTLTVMLQLVMLTDDELAHLQTYGIESFQQAVAEEGINLFDLRR